MLCLLNIPFSKKKKIRIELSSSVVNILITLSGIRKNYTHSYLKNKQKLLISLQIKGTADSKSWLYRYRKSLSPATSFLPGTQL